MSEQLTQTWRDSGYRLIHDADCWFCVLKICTCGLIHRLSVEDSRPDWFHEELVAHKKQLGFLFRAAEKEAT